MQENVRFFDIKLHKNAYFSVCKVHKIAKSVISIGQKDYVKKSQTNIKVRTESAKDDDKRIKRIGIPVYVSLGRK